MKLTITLKTLAAALLVGCAALVSACNNDDDTIVFYSGMGTVKTQTGATAIAFDGDRTLNVADSLLLVLNDARRDGQRVIATFQYADEGRMPNTIYLADVYRVLTKPFFEHPTTAERDSLGHDAVDGVAAWVSGGHLNVKFRLATARHSLRRHFINLIDNDERDAEGYIVLELAHNRNGNPREVWSTGYASFPLTEITNDVKRFRIRYKGSDGSTQTVTVEGEQAAAAVRLSDAGALVAE